MNDGKNSRDQKDTVTPGLLGAVLCGGQSSRMGTDKAQLRMRPGIRQLDYAIGLLRAVCPSVIACTGPRGRWQAELPSDVAGVTDPGDIAGPMAGIVAALEAADGRAVLAVACDMPWLDAALLARLVRGRDPSKLITAFAALDGKPEPMCAVYEPAALQPLRRQARGGDTGLRQFMARAPVKLLRIDDARALVSVNDTRELEDARRRLAASDT